MGARVRTKIMSTTVNIQLADFDKTPNQLRYPCPRTWVSGTRIEEERIRTELSCGSQVLSDSVHWAKRIIRSIRLEQSPDFDGFSPSRWELVLRKEGRIRSKEQKLVPSNRSKRDEPTTSAQGVKFANSGTCGQAQKEQSFHR